MGSFLEMRAFPLTIPLLPAPKLTYGRLAPEEDDIMLDAGIDVSLGTARGTMVLPAE
jgi:hypothetical protein